MRHLCRLGSGAAGLMWRLALSFITGALRSAPWLPLALLSAVLALGASNWYVYSRGRHAGVADVQARWDAGRAKAAEQLASLESEYRAREQHLQRANQEISDDLHMQLDQTRSEYLLALDAVRAGAGQLRQQFRGCAADLSGTSGTPGPTGGDDGAGAGGLSAEDVQVALSLARDADRVAHRLQACQAWVNNAQAQF